MSCYKLKEIVNDPRFNKQHGLFSSRENSEEIDRDKPDEAKLTQHARIMTYQINSGFMKQFFADEHV